jgi:hypothetical protein
MSKQNVVWWIGIKNEELSDKYGGFDYFEYSRKTWESWCKKNDVLFVPFEEPVEENLFKYRVNWQKAIFVFDEMDRRGIDYNQIALVDSSAMIKWDAPNFFDMTDNRFTAWVDNDNLKWIYESIQGYKPYFDDFELTHLHRKEMFSYNWQLNEDKTPFFIKYGYVWFFNGIPKNERTNMMKQLWDFIKGQYE